MQDSFRAVYRNGAFVPVIPCSLPEETEVQIVIQEKPQIVPPRIVDPQERSRVRKEVVANMRRNLIPQDAPRFTREELHERR